MVGKREPCGTLTPAELEPCGLCGRGLMHSQAVAFYRVTVRQYVIDLKAVQKLAAMSHLTGNEALGEALAPVDTVAYAPAAARPMLVCLDCAVNVDTTLGGILEAQNAREVKG